jgi:hypothetical protein
VGERTRTLACLVVVTAAALLASPAAAGSLATNPLAYNDGATVWHGSTDFASGPLNGTVDWAVFEPGMFTLAYPGSGYVPPAGELVYAYQVNAVGLSEISTLDVAIFPDRPRDHIGWFSLGPGETAPSEMALNPGASTVHWLFPGINPGTSSTGLVFSSPRIPEELGGSLLNSGLSAWAMPLPTPSTVPVTVPEPGTALLVIIGGLVLGFGWIVRRRK